jgi:hypothetical protein
MSDMNNGGCLDTSVHLLSHVLVSLAKHLLGIGSALHVNFTDTCSKLLLVPSIRYEY